MLATKVIVRLVGTSTQVGRGLGVKFMLSTLGHSILQAMEKWPPASQLLIPSLQIT